MNVKIVFINDEINEQESILDRLTTEAEATSGVVNNDYSISMCNAILTDLKRLKAAAAAAPQAEGGKRKSCKGGRKKYSRRGHPTQRKKLTRKGAYGRRSR